MSFDISIIYYCGSNKVINVFKHIQHYKQTLVKKKKNGPIIIVIYM